MDPSNSGGFTVVDFTALQTTLMNLQQTRPIAISLEVFMQLAMIFDGRIRPSRDQDQQLLPQLVKLSDRLLIDFQRDPTSWEVVFQALQANDFQGQPITEAQLFQAANIFKNKAKIDFIALKVQASPEEAQAKMLQIRQSLIAIIKKLTSERRPNFIIDTLCLALTYVIYHTHQIGSYVDELKGALASTAREMISLANVTKLIASECENDDIVIEESLRESMYNNIDLVCVDLLQEGLNKAAEDILSGQHQLFVQTPADHKDLEMRQLKIGLFKSMTAWMKLRLPNQIIKDIHKTNNAMFNLIFSELNSSQSSEDKNSAATECVIQLLTLSKKSREFQELADFMLAQVEILLQLVPQIVESKNTELGELYQEILMEIGRQNISKIVKGESKRIVTLMLDFLGMNCLYLTCLDDFHVDKIKGHHQAPFWRSLIDEIEKYGSDEYKEQIIANFELEFRRLLAQIIKQMEVNPVGTFLEFNCQPIESEEFDFYFDTKRDLGKIVRKLTDLLGVERIAQWMNEPFKIAVEQAKANPTNDISFVKLHAVLSVYEQVARKVEHYHLGSVRDLITLVFELPHEQYMGLRLVTIEIVEDLSFVLKEKNENNEYMWGETTKFLEFVIESLGKEQSEREASLCFKKICLNTENFLHSAAGEIIEKVIPKDLSEWRSEEKKINIFTGLSYLILCEQNTEVMQANLQVIFERLVTPLQSSLEFIRGSQANFQSGGANQGELIPERQINELVYSSACSKLDLMSEFTKDLKGLQNEGDSVALHPFSTIFDALWKVIHGILTEFPQLEKLCESSMRLFKHCIRILPSSFSNNIHSFLRQVITNFNNYPCSAFIYSVQNVFDEYSDIVELEPIFQEAFEAIVAKCKVLLRSRDMMEEEPLITEDFFAFCRTYLLKMKYAFFSSPNADEVLNMIVTAIGLTHEYAAASHSKLIKELLIIFKIDFLDNMKLRSVPMAMALAQTQLNPEVAPVINKEVQLLQFFMQQGQSLMQKYMFEIVSAPPRQVVDHLIGVFVDLYGTFLGIKYSPSIPPHEQLLAANGLTLGDLNQMLDNMETSREWLKACLDQVAMNIFTQDEKDRLMKKLEKARHDREMQNEPKLDFKQYLTSELHIIEKRARNLSRR